MFGDDVDVFLVLENVAMAQDIGVTGAQLDQLFDFLIGVKTTRRQKPLVDQDHVQRRLALRAQAIRRHLR
jgi:hypothetical protein